MVSIPARGRAAVAFADACRDLKAGTDQWYESFHCTAVDYVLLLAEVGDFASELAAVGHADFLWTT